MLLICFFFSSRRRHTRYWRDWSSDVCSSDLTAPWMAAGVVPTACRTLTLYVVADALAVGRTARAPAVRAAAVRPRWRFEIGRASCRGRVLISVVAVSFKKKKISHDADTASD